MKKLIILMSMIIWFFAFNGPAVANPTDVFAAVPIYDQAATIDVDKVATTAPALRSTDTSHLNYIYSTRIQRNESRQDNRTVAWHRFCAFDKTLKVPICVV